MWPGLALVLWHPLPSLASSGAQGFILVGPWHTPWSAGDVSPPGEHLCLKPQAMRRCFRGERWVQAEFPPPSVPLILQNTKGTSGSQILPLAKSGGKVLPETEAQRSLVGTCLAAVQVANGEMGSHIHLQFVLGIG